MRFVTTQEDRRQQGAAVCFWRFRMGLVVVALIGDTVTLVEVVLSNSRSRAVMEAKIDEPSRRDEKQVKWTYLLEQDVTVSSSRARSSPTSPTRRWRGSRTC